MLYKAHSRYNRETEEPTNEADLVEVSFKNGNLNLRESYIREYESEDKRTVNR